MSGLLAALFGLSGAIVYGAADFFGGLASRRLGALRSAGLAAVSGLVVLLLAVPLFGAAWSPEALLYGALSGVAGALGLSLLYGCLAIGPMSVLSPITALVSAVVPLTWGLLRGERVGPLGTVGLVLALLAVVLVAFVPERTAVRATPRGILMALGAGTMIGLFLVLIDAAPDESGLAPLLANRLVNATIMFTAVAVVALAGRAPRIVDARRGLWLALACGALDGTANALLLAGVRTGDLTIMSVLTALYPAGTIALAALVLRERITLVQGSGLALAGVAAVLLAVG
ncbi:DMT family transporter [Naasia sp. SYSU D00057]|uniref:DMT family transporter n=1 Tax=Naasia sp. SYSU D00057 TaxID=2817380 RepID=UPI001B309419|nr:DMT family transporter [Naasia sp. SYSU D00057]